MKLSSLSVVLAMSTLILAFAVEAHDTEEHMEKVDKPNCAALKDMDHAKMDMNDPVMQAMIQQCARKTDESHEHDEHATSEKPEKHKH